MTFSDGVLVANRFLIVRFLGRGGMGEVYEAEDRELGERVALKTLRSNVAAEPQALDRFRREVRLGRRVTHANVCRVFDVFRHVTSDRADGSEVTFVSMELLAGIPLSERLRQEGRLEPAQALPIVEQIAAGLDAAHRAGVVHRDFKSANVMLVPEPDAGVRAVITDFGFAHAAFGDEDLTITATTSGLVWGTPGYLAPEQVTGGPITPAADVFALGVVMYEMVTGSRPFDADTPLATAVKRLQQDALSPAVLVPKLDRRWEQTILRCLARRPEQRFSSGAEIVAALRGDTAPQIATPLRRKTTTVALAAGLTALLMAAGLTAFWFMRSPDGPGSPAAAPITPRQSIAVLGFRNLSGSPEVAWLSTAFSEILSAELAAGEQFRVLPGENVARMKADLALAEAESFGMDTLQRIRLMLGSDVVVLGSYLVAGDEGQRRIRVDVKVQDATSGETIAVVTDTALDSELLDLASRSGALVRARLGAPALSPSETQAARAAVPTTTEAARLYADALTRLRRYEVSTARDLLERAIAANPTHPLAHAELAAAWSRLGYMNDAQRAARRAVELSGDLSRAEKLWVEGRYRETTREWPKAVETYQSLFKLFPDNVDYGLQLASAQTSASQGEAALSTLDTLRALPAPFRDDPRIDLSEAVAAQSTTDFKRAHAAAVNARAKAADQGARLLVARARLEEGWALWNLGRPAEAIVATDDARQRFNDAGDRGSVARATINMAIIRARQGEFDRANALYEEALTTQRALGNDGGVAFALNNLANLLADRRQYALARRAYDEALVVNRKIGNKTGEAGVLGNIANLLQYDGQLAESRRMHEASLALQRESGAKMSIAIELTNMASVLVDQGDMGEARRLLGEALAIKREVGSRSSIAFTLTTLADVLLAQGDFAAARTTAQEALGIRQQLGERPRAAENRLQLALLTLEEGDARAAETAAADVVASFKAERDVESEAAALGVVALAALAQNDADRARSAIDRVERLLPQVATRVTRLRLILARARVDAAAGRSAMALSSARSAAAEAQRFQLGLVNLEARVAAATIELDNGGGAATRSQLQALEREAAGKGLGLIVRRIGAPSRLP
jgi:tetratricopeptide (TPR) repeat protein/tRNA A-37 threonylcarbamoyl transferase component Bud32